MAAMVAAAAMADEPVAELGVAVEGSETLTWGVDLDEGDTGFKNEATAKVTVTFAKGGEKKSEEGEGIWAEVSAKLDGDLKYKFDGDGSESFVRDSGKSALGEAKLHIGPMYIGLKKGDIKVGEVKLPNAVYAEDSTRVGLGNVGGDQEHGLTVGYGSDDFGFAVDFRSLPGVNDLGNGVDYYDNHYGLAAEAELKDSNAFVSGLAVKAGVSYAFEEKLLGIGASAGYKLPVGDTFYVKPTVAFTGSKADTADLVANLGASVIFGFGGDQKDDAGVYYLDNGDAAKKVTPGVGVAFLMPNMTADAGYFEIVPSFYSGDIVPGLKAAVIGDLIFPRGYDPAPDPIIGVAGGVSYELAVGDSIKIIPKAGFRFATDNVSTITGVAIPALTKAYDDNGAYNDVADADITDDATNKGLLNFKAGVDISGLINNTTFGAYYQSRNLKALKDDGKAGTFNVFVKVSI